MINPGKLIQQVEHNQHEGGEGTEYIVHHLSDSNTMEFFGYEVHLPDIHLFGLDLSITKHVVMIWLAALLISFIFIWAARRRKKETIPTGFANLLEIIVLFVRDEIVYTNFGKEGKKFVPFFQTVFFFILACNLLGLVPFGATATGNVTVTGVMALITLITIVISGIVEHGLFGYAKSFIPSGVPFWIIPVMFVVEIMGLISRIFALAIRLFANMTAGHAVILALLGLIIKFETYAVAPFPILMVIGVELLEIFIAFLQAYIFTFLSAIFVGAAIHPHH